MDTFWSGRRRPSPRLLGRIHERLIGIGDDAVLAYSRQDAFRQPSRMSLIRGYDTALGENMAHLLRFPLLFLVVCGDEQSPQRNPTSSSVAVPAAYEVCAKLSHPAPVYCVAFAPDGSRLATGGGDRTVRLWELSSWMEQSSIVAPLAPGEPQVRPAVRTLAWSRDGTSVVVPALPSGLAFYDSNDRSEVRRFDSDDHRLLVYSVAYSSDGRTIATGGRAYEPLVLWNAEAGNVQKTIQAHSRPVLCVAFSPDQRMVATASEDGLVKLWDAKTGKMLRSLRGHSDWVFSVCFSPDSKSIASGSYDRSVRIWDTSTGDLKHTLNGHADGVSSVAFSPDGTWLASGSYDRTIRLWDPNVGAEKATLQGHKHWVLGVTFSPDSKLLASASFDNTARVWRLNSAR